MDTAAPAEEALFDDALSGLESIFTDDELLDDAEAPMDLDCRENETDKERRARVARVMRERLQSRQRARRESRRRGGVVRKGASKDSA